MRLLEERFINVLYPLVRGGSMAPPHWNRGGAHPGDLLPGDWQVTRCLHVITGGMGGPGWLARGESYARPS